MRLDRTCTSRSDPQRDKAGLRVDGSGAGRRWQARNTPTQDEIDIYGPALQGNALIQLGQQ